MPSLPVALTMGDPAGIGGEITLRAWHAHHDGAESLPVFFAVDDPDRLTAQAAALALEVPVAVIADPGEAAAVFATALPVLPLRRRVATLAGGGGSDDGEAVAESLDRAIDLALEGRVAAVTTNPADKKTLRAGGIRHAGHTGHLAERTRADDAVMLLVCPGLRVVPLTVHVPLSAVPGLITASLLEKTAQITQESLRRDFGIERPRLAVTGLNPHAGEGGMLGSEEQDIIAPTVARMQAAGMDIRGPLPADSLFHPDARGNQDAVLCMYHDQALIPLKTLDFHGGVNVTIGLPIVRTSPDHGTAPDIAGTGVASAESLMSALRLARQIADNRAVGRSA